MRSLLIGTFVGACGSILFEALNQWAGWVAAAHPTKWLVLGGVFVIFFLASVLIDRKSGRSDLRKSVGSDNISEAGQDLDIGAAAIRHDTDIVGSNNRSKGDQKIVIGK